MNSKHTKLDCGIWSEVWTYKKKEIIEIDLVDLYNGGKNTEDGRNVLLVMSEMFKELSDKGFENTGISPDWGYYDDIEAIKLRVERKIK